MISVPSDMLGEIVKHMPYESIMNLCRTDRRFRDYCHTHSDYLDDLLLNELLRKNAKDLNLALVSASNNYRVFSKLIQKGANPIKQIYADLDLDDYENYRFTTFIKHQRPAKNLFDSVIKNQNTEIILYLLKAIESDPTLSELVKTYLMKEIIEPSSSNKNLFPLLLRDFKEYMTPELLLGAIGTNSAVLNNILDNFSKIDTNKYDFRWDKHYPPRQGSYYFLITLIVYAYIYKLDKSQLIQFIIDNDLSNFILGNDREVISDMYDTLEPLKKIKKWYSTNRDVIPFYEDLVSLLDFNPSPIAHATLTSSLGSGVANPMQKENLSSRLRRLRNRIF